MGTTVLKFQKNSGYGIPSEARVLLKEPEGILNTVVPDGQNA